MSDHTAGCWCGNWHDPEHPDFTGHAEPETPTPPTRTCGHKHPLLNQECPQCSIETDAVAQPSSQAGEPERCPTCGTSTKAFTGPFPAPYRNWKCTDPWHSSSQAQFADGEAKAGTPPRGYDADGDWDSPVEVQAGSPPRKEVMPNAEHTTVRSQLVIAGDASAQTRSEAGTPPETHKVFEKWEGIYAAQVETQGKTPSLEVDQRPCMDCGVENPVWFAENDVWNAVFPERVGLVCPNCFIKRADPIIPNTGWKLVPDRVEAQAGTALPAPLEFLQQKQWGEGTTPEHLAWLDRVAELSHEVEDHCPCGARPESIHTHPHVPGCPVEKLVKMVGDFRKLSDQATNHCVGLQKELDELKAAQAGTPPPNNSDEDQSRTLAMGKGRTIKAGTAGTPRVYKFPNAPESCEECDSTCFITAGGQNLVCYHCFLVSEIAKARSEGAEAMRERAAKECEQRFVGRRPIGGMEYCADLAHVIRALSLEMPDTPQKEKPNG